MEYKKGDIISVSKNMLEKCAGHEAFMVTVSVTPSGEAYVIEATAGKILISSCIPYVSNESWVTAENMRNAGGVVVGTWRPVRRFLYTGAKKTYNNQNKEV
jgi:hypothetical protein